MAKYIAKIDENNVVTQVLTAAGNKIKAKDGSYSQAKAQEFATEVNGPGTYILYTDDMSGTYPAINDTWSAEDNHFHGPRPLDRNGNECTSWTLNENCFWIGPTKQETGRARFEWDEAEKRWYSKPAGSAGETANWSYWNGTTWVEITG